MHRKYKNIKLKIMEPFTKGSFLLHHFRFYFTIVLLRMAELQQSTGGMVCQKMKNKKLFLKYLGRYCGIFVIVLISSLLLVMRAYQITERNVMEENTWRLQSGLDKLENQLTRMSSMTETLRQVTSLNYLKSVEGELKISEYVYLNALEEQLKNISILYDFASMEFMMFQNNDCYISNTQVTDAFQNYYGEFFQFEGISARDFKQIVFGQEQKMYLMPGEYLKYNKYGIMTETENPILCVIRPSLGGQASLVDESVAVVFVIEQEKILDLLLGNEGDRKAVLQLYDSGDNLVFGSGTAQDGDGQRAFSEGDKSYRYADYEGSEKILKVKAGFSSETVQRYILELMGMLILYVFLGLGAAVVLSLILAGREYRSMHGLITDVVSKSDAEVTTAKNEYDLLSQSFSQMAQTREEYRTKVTLLENQMKNSILENALLQGLYTEESRQRFRQVFSVDIEYYCVAVMKIDAECAGLSPEISLEARTRMDELLGQEHPFMSVLSGSSQEIFLIPRSLNDVTNVNQLQEKFEKLITGLSAEYGITFPSGISAIRKGLENLHSCYVQAIQVLQAFEVEHTNTVGNYYLLKGESRLPALVDLEFMQKLTNLVLCAEEEAAGQLFDKIIKNFRRNAPLYEIHREEAFYAVRNVEAGLLEQQIFSGCQLKLPEYRADIKFEVLMESLRELALKLCEVVRNNKKSKNVELKESIIGYLESNFCDPGLTAARLSQDIGISEKYLYQFIKEQTGTTFAAYLEQLRMGRAEELLLTTGLSNTAVAEKSGFGSANTFYRVFSKNKGISPGKFRENFKKNE